LDEFEDYNDNGKGLSSNWKFGLFFTGIGILVIGIIVLLFGQSKADSQQNNDEPKKDSKKKNQSD